MGPSIVVFTLGAKGCVGYSKEEGFFELPSFDVVVQDTVGAGDVFHGAYVVGLLRGYSAKEAARLATAVSCIKCTRIGSRAGIPDWDTVQKYLKTGEIDYTELTNAWRSMGEIATMKKQSIVLGVAPTKRSFLSMEEAKRQKDKFMAVIRSIHPDVVTIVDIDDICENGILYETAKIPAVVDKFKAAKIDALFTPHCDFGEEQCAAAWLLP